MEGVGLIPYAFAPHYHSPHPESEAVNGLVNFYEREGIKYKAISDGEVIITVT
jgi:dipeptidase E